MTRPHDDRQDSWRAVRKRTVPDPGHPLDANVLARHRAKILRPEDAVPAWDGSTVRPTAYRYERLLIPEELLADPGFRDFLDAQLRTLQLMVEDDGNDPRPGEPGYPLDLRLPRRSVRLVPLRSAVPERPTDSWHALQVLLAASQQDERRKAQLDEVSLDHILFAATGIFGQALIEGGPGSEGHGFGSDRIPVLLPLAPPPPPAGGGPVIAVLDTGCAVQHPWLSTGVTLAAAPKPPGTVPITGLSEITGDEVDQLLGELDTHAGHGTFIAGIIRQIAPDARIEVYPVMHSDGLVHEADVEYQLGVILARAEAASKARSRAGFVDVVSMSFGGFGASFTPSVLVNIRQKLEALSSLGVMIVASAGNFASATEVYPAAFSVAAWPAKAARVVSVGALVRPGTVAIYSDQAPWVTAWFPGSSIVSTFPSFRGARTPRLVRPGTAASPPREGFDPDDFAYRFGVWGGTSFAAAICGARLAWLLTAPQPPPVAGTPAPAWRTSDITNLDPDIAMARATWATGVATAETWPP
jgi:hypothetical protein